MLMEGWKMLMQNAFRVIERMLRVFRLSKLQ